MSVSLASLLLVLVAIYEGARAINGGAYVARISIGWILILMPIALMLERGRNWARWVLLCLTGLAALSLVTAFLVPTPGSAKLIPDDVHAIRSLSAVLCLVTATMLVFGPGRAWFRRRDCGS